MNRFRWVIAAGLSVALLGCASDDDAGEVTTPASQAATTEVSAASSSPSTESSVIPSGSSAQDTTTVTPDQPAGGELTWATVDAPTSLDPHLEAGLGEIPFYHAMWDRLFEIDSERQVQPGLATDVTVSADGLTATVKLRSGATFHDGTPVDAESVKQSLERGRDMPTSTAAADLKIITGISVVDDLTVDLTLSAPAPYLKAVLATKAGSVISRTALEGGIDFSLDPNDYSSGPYLVDEFVPNESIVLTRRTDGYWDPEAGSLDKLTITVITDPQAALNAVRTGEVDAIVARGSGDELQGVVDGDDELELYSYTAASTTGLFLRNTLEPLKDIRVRQAIAHALNRKAASEGLLKGDCAYNPEAILPGAPGYVEGYDPFPYDPDRARELLEEAGYADGLKLEFMTPAGLTTAETLALGIQQDLAAVGIELTLRPVAQTDVVEVWTEGNTQGYISGLGAGADDYLSFARWMYGTWSLAGPEDAAVKAAMAEVATPNLSDGELRTASQNLTKSAMELATMIPFCNGQSRFIASSDVSGMDRLGWAWSADAAADPRYLATAR